MTVGELGFAKVFKLHQAFCLPVLFAIASCGGSGNDGSNTTSKPNVPAATVTPPDTSSNAAKVVEKNSSAGTSAFVMSVLVAD